MCWIGWDRSDDAVGLCPDCGTAVDADGQAVRGCAYGSKACDTCGHKPCDGSC